MRTGAVQYCMHAQYNPIEYAQQLETAGVPKAQAEVHAQALGQVISSCLDAEAEATLRVELAGVEARLRGEIQSSDARLTSQIQILEAKTASRFETLESSLRAEMNFLKWMNGLTLALVVGQYVRSWLA